VSMRVRTSLLLVLLIMLFCLASEGAAAAPARAAQPAAVWPLVLSTVVNNTNVRATPGGLWLHRR